MANFEVLMQKDAMDPTIEIVVADTADEAAFKANKLGKGRIVQVGACVSDKLLAERAAAKVEKASK